MPRIFGPVTRHALMPTTTFAGDTRSCTNLRLVERVNPEPITVWKVVRRLDNGSLVSAYQEPNEPVYPQLTYALDRRVAQCVAFKSRQAANNFNQYVQFKTKGREIWRAECDAISENLPSALRFDSNSVSCTNLRLVAREWPEFAR